MNIYNLRPKVEGLENSNWQASTHKESCLVYADNVQEAIKFAYDKFRTAVLRPPLGQKIPTNPWNNPDLVMIIEVADMSGVLPPKGTVCTAF